jgi:ATP-dependent Clp protease ATP-binding subunit ClpA
MEEFKKTVNPEFFNRLDAAIVFHTLTREQNKKILELVLNQLNQRLAVKEMTLKLLDKAKDFLLEHGFEKNLGARPLKRAIQKYIEDPMAISMLESHFGRGTKVLVDWTGVDGDHLTFTYEKEIVVEGEKT